MSTQNLLTRNYTLARPDGHSHRIKTVRIRRGQSLEPGEVVCSLEYKRGKRSRRDSSETVYVAEHAFDVEKYGAVEVLDVAAKVGQDVPEGGRVLFIYLVSSTLENALEPILADMVTDVANLHSSHEGIPSSKLEGAVEEYAKSVDPGRILFLYDDTIFGSAKTGFVITDCALYIRNDDASYEIRFNQMRSWTQREDIVPQDKGDSVLVKDIEILGEGATIKIPHSAGMLDWANAGKFLDALVALKQEGKTKDVDGPVAIEELSDEVKLAYVEAIIWLVHHDDGSIDVREFGELRLLMTQLNFSGELRRRTLAMMDDAHDLTLDSILDRLNDNVPKGAERPVAFSLLKDMVRVFKSHSDGAAADSPQIEEACRLLGIGEEQLAVVEEAVEFDKQLFDGSVSSGELRKLAEGLASKAASVGVPIAAVYMSGSVVGLSAAGMTSGLAALGFGGLLGLSAMATGIGVAALIGVAAYRGVRWVVSENEDKRRAQRTQLRDLMLQEVLRNHQKAIAALGEDLAYFAQKVVDLSKNVLENELRIERLGKEVTLFADALAHIRQRGETYEKEIGRNREAQGSGGTPALHAPEGDAT